MEHRHWDCLWGNSWWNIKIPGTIFIWPRLWIIFFWFCSRQLTFGDSDVGKCVETDGMGVSLRRVGCIQIKSLRKTRTQNIFFCLLICHSQLNRPEYDKRELHSEKKTRHKCTDKKREMTNKVINYPLLYRQELECPIIWRRNFFFIFSFHLI